MTDSGISNQLTINEPQVYLFDMLSVNVGMTFHIYGKNLYFEKGTLHTSVNFVSPSGFVFISFFAKTQWSHSSNRRLSK